MCKEKTKSPYLQVQVQKSRRMKNIWIELQARQNWVALDPLAQGPSPIPLELLSVFS
jgi:hypothetical protein